MNCIVKWTGWVMNEEKRWLRVEYRHTQVSVRLVSQQEATVFPMRRDATAFCKKHIRKGRFGGDLKGLEFLPAG